jgi:hypothetical protein
MKRWVASRWGLGLAAGLAAGVVLTPAAWGDVEPGEEPPAQPPAAEAASEASAPVAAPAPAANTETSAVTRALVALAQAQEAPAPPPAEGEAASSGGGRGGVQWSGSGELLGWTTLSGSMRQGIFTRNNPNADFVITHVHPKLSASLGPKALAYAELCITHPRVGPQPEQAYLEYSQSELLTIQAGRFLVPFGQWNQIHDVFDHKSIAYPLMYLGHEEEELELQGGPRPIVSTAFTDIGLLAYGSIWPRPTDQIWYGAYVSNGRFGGTDIEWLDLWNTVRDNNSNKAIGGRAVWTHGDNLSVGGSYQTGRYDIQGRLRYELGGVDVYYRLGKNLNLRAEYVRNPVDSPIRGYTKTGWWVSADRPVGKRHEVVATYSHLRQRPAERVEELSRATVGFNTYLTRAMKLKTELDFLNIGRFVGDPADPSDTQFGTRFRDVTRFRASVVAIF